MFKDKIIACLICPSGEEERLWCEVAADVKDAAYSGESGTIYTAILDDDSKNVPDMTKGTFVTLTTRGWKEPSIVMI